MKLLLKPILASLCLIIGYTVTAQLPTLNVNGLDVNSKELNTIDTSKAGEITIVSMNIRDMTGRTRTLSDYAYLSELLGAADVIVLQEIGAKGYYRSTKEDMNKRLNAFIALFKSYLGEEWEHVVAPHPTPEALGGAAEIPLMFYKTQRGKTTITAKWDSYFDLGEKRDMGVFEVDLKNRNKTETIKIGSLHTKPACPYRGQELLKVAEFAESTTGSFIVCGDFNWGYKSTCENGYEGEKQLLSLAQANSIHMPFESISYLGKGDIDNFRSNLMIRKSVFFYDQFIISSDLAKKYADNCTLSEDCGFVSISTSKEFKSIVESEAKTQMKGAKTALKVVSKEDSCTVLNMNESLSKAEEVIIENWKTSDVASYSISDHKPIWIQFKLF